MIPNDQISLRNQNPRKVPRRRLDIFQSLRSHLGLVAALFLVVGAVGGYMAYTTDRPVYVSEGEIQVARKYQRIVEADREFDLGSTRDYEIFRNEQVALLYKPEVLIDALKRAEQYDLPYWGVPDEPDRLKVERFENSIVAYTIPNSYRIKVELYAATPEIAQPLLSALMESFIEAHRREFGAGEDTRIEVVRSLLDKSDERIEELRSELRTLANELQVIDFQASPENPFQGELQESRQALAEARRDWTELDLSHQELLSATGSEEDLLILLAQGQASADDSPLAQALRNLLLEREEVQSSLLEMGPQHPGRPEAESRLKNLQPRIEDAMTRYTEAQVSESERNLRLAKSRVDTLDEEVGKLQTASAGFVEGFQRGIDLERQIADELPRNRQFRDRMAGFELEAESPGFVSVAREASEVDPNGQRNLKKKLALAILLALAVALGTPILIDLLDRKVHTTQDVELALGIPPAAWIPRSTRGPRKAFADAQVRRLAMLMDNEERRMSPHITLFTEIRNSAGLPDLIVASAKTLADLGREILVVDARQPADGNAAVRGTGFQGLLAGDGLKPERRDGWHYLPFGMPAHGGPVSLSAWNRIVRDTCRDFDMVLVVAPPLLVSPEAEYMSASADLVLVVAEAEKQTLGELYRAGQILARLRPAAVGSVLNGVKVFRNRGYYKELVRDTKQIA